MGKTYSCIMCGGLLDEEGNKASICSRCRLQRERQTGAVDQKPEGAPGTGPEEPPAGIEVKATILIIDDEPSIVKLLGNRIRRAGYHILEASDGSEGFEIIQRERPDLVISDILMPRMTGYDLLQLMKKQAYGVQDIPVIIITARGSMKDFFSDWEIHAFIEKPINPDTLLKTIEELLKKRKSK